MMSIYLLGSCAAQDPYLRKARSTSQANPSQALRNYSIAIRHNPKNTRTAEEGSSLALRYGRPDSVVQWLLMDGESDNGLSDRALLYLADAYLLNAKPQEAIRRLKELLRKNKLADSLRSEAEQLLIWAENALWALEAPPIALVQPLDSPINSRFDEWGSILSPYTLRWYFTRSRAPQALRRPLQSAKRPFAILFGENDSAHHRPKVQPLTPYFNYQPHWLALLDLAADATAMWYFKGHSPRQGSIYHLPYDQLHDSAHSSLGTLPPGFHAQKGLCMIGDSLMIYASDAPGGLGGYDLYLMRKQGNQWSTPINLGHPINTPMDEVTPFYHAKSRHLYFSSNRRESFGHFDVFRLSFDIQQSKGGAIHHLAMPVNSTADDLFFRLYDDGLTASLTSNRPSKYGGLDLYQILFNEPQYEAKPADTTPLLLSWVSTPADALPTPQSDTTVTTHHTYALSPVSLDSPSLNNDLLDPQITILRELLQRYPHMRISIRSYVYSEDDDVANHHRSFAIAERVRKYLNQHGIGDSSIITQGYGSRHRRAINRHPNTSTASDTTAARIEWHLHPRPLEISPHDDGGPFTGDTMPQPFFKIALPPHGEDSPLAKLVHAANHGLIERIGDSAQPDTLIGLFHSYERARSWLKKLRAMYPHSSSHWKIFPYFKGRRLTQHEIVKLKEQFPQLNAYFTHQLRAKQ